VVASRLTCPDCGGVRQAILLDLLARGWGEYSKAVAVWGWDHA
jgi:hypothetical protein